MPKPVKAKYGSWASPISAQIVAAGARGIQQIMIDGEKIYWVETRPDEGGRYVVMTNGEDGPKTLTPAGYSARSTVNSYGGASALVHEGVVYFANFNPKAGDQNLYRQETDGTPQAITDTGKTTYADFVFDQARNRLIGIRESDTEKLHGQPKQDLVALCPHGGKPAVALAEGMDFYAAPAISPDGKRIAWISWNYPSMPWDGTQLFVADFADDGTLINVLKIAGEPTSRPQGEGENPIQYEAACFSNQSIMQPKWRADGTLMFVSDAFEKDGERWWSLFHHDGNNTHHLTDMAAAIGGPAWNLGFSTYDILADGSVILAFTSNGEWQLAHLQTESGQGPRKPGDAGFKHLDIPFSEIGHVRALGNDVCMVGGSYTQPSSLVRLEGAEFSPTIIRSSMDREELNAICDVLCAPEFISFKSKDGATAHGFHYPPHNPAHEGVDGEKPPLLIFVHGGPTAGATAALQPKIQYFTSRGFAVLDMMYRGSTGFGRGFHQSLYGHWGVKDIDDCVAGAKELARQGKIDGKRVASRGGSSGGYTTLALATFTKELAAAVSYYGISNLEMIAKLTDKLEARYAELMIGPYPQDQEVFKERSPFFEASKLTTPLLIFQGCDDPVVPPPQAEVMIRELFDHGLPVAYKFFPGESHGFRIRQHIIECQEAELAFYAKLMGFDVPQGTFELKLYNYPKPETDKGTKITGTCEAN